MEGPVPLDVVVGRCQARRVVARNGALTPPASGVEKLEEVREDSNPLGELIEAGWLARDPDATVAAAGVRFAMEVWANHRDYRPTWVPNPKRLAALLHALRGSKAAL
jgi:hypothetical protein